MVRRSLLGSLAAFLTFGRRARQPGQLVITGVHFPGGVFIDAPGVTLDNCSVAADANSPQAVIRYLA